MNEDNRAWALLEKVVTESQREQKKARRWSILFKLLTFLYLGALLLMWVSSTQRVANNMHLGSDSDAHVASISINGPIMKNAETDSSLVIESLENAFNNAQTKAVMLVINSPGGSPVQSGYVYDAIQRLRAEHKNIAVYAVIEDIGASGAYYIAAAADKIFADKASLVGSIGVISSGFGFVGAMKKLGIERRAYHAGKNKALLDPFSPQDPKQTEFWQQVLATTHQQFIDQVKKGRGDRLQDSPEIFSGLIWTGEQALELGLIDGLGSVRSVAKEQAGTDNIVDYTVSEDPLQKIIGRLGTAVGKGIAQQLGIKQQFELN